ncbi:MAG: efflux RND transporter periplasmic adaptor subunit [Bacteroidetes bacterium]|nr:MAG: efflux RND transporter periplasmic adaptor subunit [Bacteroidota bacterium]
MGKMKNILANISSRQIWLGLGLIAFGLLLGRLFFGGTAHSGHTLEEGQLHSTAAQTTIWTCSMHPQIRQNEPGQCPICGMDLIPLDESGGAEVAPDELQMTEAAMRLAEVQTTRVSKSPPERELLLNGKVYADETRIAEMTARFPGRIEKLYVNFKGQSVRRGQKLASVYSPELITAQKELLEAIKMKEYAPQMYQAARSKLKLWDLNEEQIRQLEQQGEPQIHFDVLSPLSGTVTMRHVALGDYVKEGMPLFEVVDLRRLWVMFDAYESDLPWIQLGNKIEFTVQSLPGQTFSGKITFIDPFIDPKTRVARIRTEVNNPGGKLKPDMFVRGRLYAKPSGAKDALMIPATAVLWTGKRAVVYVKVPGRAQPTFAYREVSLGEAAGDFYIVKDGLQEGEEVVSYGAFKVDAAAQLQAKPSMMNPGGGKSATGHQHGSMAGMDQMPAQPEAGSVDPAFGQQLHQVYQHYLAITEALVADDAAAAAAAAQQALEALKQVDMKLLKGAAHQHWMQQQPIIQQALEQMTATDLQAQRKALAALTPALYQSFQALAAPADTIYYQYCPMADNDQGAFWLSSQKEIKNPYFGAKMLKCGENRGIISHSSQ